MRRLALGLLAGAATAPALADDADLWVAPAAFVCLEQDPAHKSTPLGASLAQNPGYLHWREHEGEAVMACLAQKKLLPAELCTGIFKMDPKGDSAAAKALYAKHADSIRGLERINECEGPPATK
jgi:hypothetical protein